MLKTKFKYNYRAYIFYIAAYFVMVLLNSAGAQGDMYSLSALYALFYMGYNFAVSFLLFNLSFIPSLNISVSLHALIASSALFAVFTVYKLFKKKPRAESLIFLAAALTYYIFFFDKGDAVRRAIVASIIVALAVVMQVSLLAIFNKLLRCRLRPDELVCIAALITAAGLGFLKLFGLDAYKAVSIFLILLCCFVLKNAGGMVVSVNLALPLAIEFGALEFVGIYTLFAFAALSFCKYSRVLSALALLLAELCAAYYFAVYGKFDYYNLLYACAGAAAFLMLPNALLDRLSKLTGAYRERHLVKSAINRSRFTVSNKLYEISNVFKELEGVFSNVRSSVIGEDAAIKCAVDEVIKIACEGCSSAARCDRGQVEAGLFKLIKIGMGKGKVNVIDIPSDISYNCNRPNSVLLAANRLLADYRTHIAEAKNNDEGRDMIARQAGGIAEILKGLALETSRVLSFETGMEKKLAEVFLSSGIVPYEILIYGDGQKISINAVLAPDLPIKLICKIVSDLMGREMIIHEKLQISGDKCAYTFKNSPPLDAVFGVAMAAKDGSQKSGDTYSVIRISEEKFMVALSDGMGTGQSAHDLSSKAISLIEGFFKTGMPTDLVLSTVNRVLNFNKEENYACLDIAMIDLTSGEAGMIKIGAPFGFIIRDNEIKILEGESPPLGILQQLKPDIKREQLAAGDMVLLISDGISLAFGSSTDMFEFLKSCPSKNPQALCDSVLKEAQRLYGGKSEDDMTALATRIFLKSA